MSTSSLKKPSRPPPEPPIFAHNRSSSSSFSRGLSVTSSNKSHTLATPSHRKSSSSSSRSKSDYIKISECHTGLPDRPFGKRASTSFSSTLKPTPSNDYSLQSSHQKSRSLTENHTSSTYLDLDLPSSSFVIMDKCLHEIYKKVDFMKTDALNKCKVERSR